MSGETWQRAEIESPCIKLCVMHPREGICMGCYRSIEEITGWTAMNSEERAALTLELPDRAERVKPARRGGRASRRS